MIVIFTILWLAIAIALCLFGFFLGRCARKLPFIDNRLPWTLSRDQVSRAEQQSQQNQQACDNRPDKPHWPDNPL
jgi:hypothetical protein